jgi:hypothetical protein
MLEVCGVFPSGYDWIPASAGMTDRLFTLTFVLSHQGSGSGGAFRFSLLSLHLWRCRRFPPAGGLGVSPKSLFSLPPRMGDQRGLKASMETVARRAWARWIPAPRFHEDKLRGNDGERCPPEADRGLGSRQLGLDESNPCATSLCARYPSGRAEGRSPSAFLMIPHEWGPGG